MDPGPYWIRIQELPGSGTVGDRIQELPGSGFANKDPDPHMQIQVKMKAKDVRFKILINNSGTRLD